MTQKPLNPIDVTGHWSFQGMSVKDVKQKKMKEEEEKFLRIVQAKIRYGLIVGHSAGIVPKDFQDESRACE